MRWLRRFLVLVLALLLVGAAGAAWVWSDRPALEELPVPPLPDTAYARGDAGLRLTFTGIATVLVSDGETALLTDGFFSRPGLLRLAFGEVAPDTENIARGLERIGVGASGAPPLTAVIPVHSHYDHAMDSPEVARRTGAVLLGSESSANIARGWGLPEEQIRVAEPDRAYRFGDFAVTLVPSRHVRYPWSDEDGGGLLGTTIDAPLVPPAPATAYKEGVTWSVLIEHPRASLLVQGSAGFVPGALDPYEADAVLLGVGALGGHPPDYTEAYYQEVVRAVGAHLVLPIHFTDFTRPLDAPPRPFPRLLDPVEEALGTLRELAEADPGVEIALLPFWEAVSVGKAVRGRGRTAASWGWEAAVPRPGDRGAGRGSAPRRSSRERDGAAWASLARPLPARLCQRVERGAMQGPVLIPRLRSLEIPRCPSPADSSWPTPPARLLPVSWAAPPTPCRPTAGTGDRSATSCPPSRTAR